MAGRKKRSGRKEGAYTLGIVKLKDLTGKFLDPEQPIVVGKKWADMQGLDVQVAPIDRVNARVEGTIIGQGVEVKKVEYND